MIQSSECINELAAALAKAQAEFPVIPKNHTGKISGEGKRGSYEYTYHYADLADASAAATPIITEHGLAVTQFPGWDGAHDTLDTRLMHVSGQWIEGSMRLFLVKEDPQSHGSAITYAKRYAYCAALGIIADEDDDASRATRATRPRPARPERESEPRPGDDGTAIETTRTPTWPMRGLLLVLALKANPENQVLSGEVHEAQAYVKAHGKDMEWPDTPELDRWLTGLLDGELVTFIGLSSSECHRAIDKAKGSNGGRSRSVPNEPLLGDEEPF